MATVTAASISVSDSLERFRQEFNTLRSDVSNITSGNITINNESNNRILTSVSTNTFNAESGLTYDGSTFAVSGAVTISGLTTFSGNLVIPNAGNIGSAGDTDAIAIASDGKTTFSQQTTHSGGILIANAGNIGSAGDTDAIAIASDGVVTFSQAPVFPDGSIAVADLDIDGATDIGAAIVDADLFIIDDGAGGTNKKTAASRLKTYIGTGGWSFGTAVSPTSVSSVTFTGVPSGTNFVEIKYAGITFNSGDIIYTQLGDSGGIETSGYLASVSSHEENVERTSEFRHHNNGMTSQGAAALIQYSRVDGNTWVMHGVSRGNLTNSFAGSKTLSGELTQLKVFSAAGENMTAGTIQISYQT